MHGFTFLRVLNGEGITMQWFDVSTLQATLGDRTLGCASRPAENGQSQYEGS
jgi:hypothetical protein